MLPEPVAGGRRTRIAAMAETAKPVDLKPEALQAFTLYTLDAERAMASSLHEPSSFLWADQHPDIAKKILGGEIPAQFFSGEGPIHVPDGLIHDWIGSAFAPGAAVHDTLILIQDYNNHKNIYKPEVIDSRLLSHHDNNFHISLRVRKKKVMTVVLDTEHDVHYSGISPTRWMCRSFTTRISEVERAGTPKETIASPESGYGFMWRLNSYWRFEERDGGTWLECRAISLSRDIPKGLSWIVEPIIRKVPRESLIHTLQATKQALAEKVVASSAR